MPLHQTKPLVLILLGPPGSGKGSQALLIKEKTGLAHISTGDILRENIKQNTALGKKAKIFIDEGKLVPDDLILTMLFDRVAQPDCKNGYILDGFPRTHRQAEELSNHLKKEKKDHHKEYQVLVINLKISDEQILERLTQRVVCEKCQTPYHLKSSPPKKPGVCDRCGGKLIHRSDDSEEVVRKRLAVYHSQTSPLIEHYGKIGILHNLQADQPKETVLKAIMALIHQG